MSELRRGRVPGVHTHGRSACMAHQRGPLSGLCRQRAFVKHELYLIRMLLAARLLLCPDHGQLHRIAQSDQRGHHSAAQAPHPIHRECSILQLASLQIAVSHVGLDVWWQALTSDGGIFTWKGTETPSPLVCWVSSQCSLPASGCDSVAEACGLTGG